MTRTGIIREKRASGFGLLTLILGVLLLVLSHPSVAAVGGHVAPHTPPLTGLWYTEGKDGGVELYSCGDEICGRFYWFNTNEISSKDEKNPDPEKRDKPLCRMQFMGGFHEDGEGRYADGWIYSPEHGAVFNAEMTLVDEDTLDLHGYVLTPILGESQTWKRAKAMPKCRDK